MLKSHRLIFLANHSPDSRLRVWVDGVEQVQNAVQVYHFSEPSDVYGYKNILIEVLDGSFCIHDDDAVALYPQDNEVGGILIKQSRYIEWFYSDTHSLGTVYSAGELVQFKHLYPQGPNYFDPDRKPIYQYETLLHLTQELKIQNSQSLIDLVINQ